VPGQRRGDRGSESDRLEIGFDAQRDAAGWKCVLQAVFVCDPALDHDRDAFAFAKR
jgi:hypothetical protein